MKDILEIGLRIGGCSLVALSFGSFWIPKALGWREKLAGLTPLMRELWWTSSSYVWASHVFFAVLALGFGDWLMGGGAAAMATLLEKNPDVRSERFRPCSQPSCRSGCFFRRHFKTR